MPLDPGLMISKPASVRFATRADEPALFWLLNRDLDADNRLGWSINPRKVLDHVQKCCRGKCGLAGIIDGPDGIAGSVGIELTTPYYSDDFMLMQIWQFVRPEHRKGTRYGQDLFDFAEWHRQDMSARLGQELVLESTILSHHRLDAKIRLWKRKKRMIGAIFW